MTTTITEDDAEAMATAPPASRSRTIDPRGTIDWSGLYWTSRDGGGDTRQISPYGITNHANQPARRAGAEALARYVLAVVLTRRISPVG